MSLQPINLQNLQYTEVSRYSDDTVCSCSIGWSGYLVLALRRVPEFTTESVHWWAQELSDALSNSSLSTMLWVLIRQTLPGFHALTGANITGYRTQGKRKRIYFKMILKHILDLTFYGYLNTYMAGITSFYCYQNNGCIGFIIFKNL